MKKMKGFSLIEAMIAVITIVIVAVASFEFLQHCQRFLVGSESRLMAINSARETMEERYWGNDITATGGWNADNLPDGILKDNRSGTRYYRIQNVAGNYYRTIEVNVGWN